MRLALSLMDTSARDAALADFRALRGKYPDAADMLDEARRIERNNTRPESPAASAHRFEA